MSITALTPEHADACVAVVATLPEWFGYDGALEGIASAVQTHTGFVAIKNEKVVGFIVTDLLFEESLEILYLAVQRDEHRSGIGRQLVHAARDQAVSLGARAVCLLTLGPSGESAFYAETVKFYQAIGFIRTKELRITQWNDAPALLMSAMTGDIN